MDIKDIQINSKLTLIEATCKNFRSIGEDGYTVKYTDYNNLVVSSDTNGVAKSTLYLYLPYFLITGNSYRQGDPVDSLINSSTGKDLEATLKFVSSGKYFMIKRCRKPNTLDLYQLIGGEYIEIPNLPVDSRSRQLYLYTLMNLDAKTAVSTIENTILLGSKFNGFLAMDAASRRDLIETVMDLGIFSTLNKETKSLRGNLITEQQQLLIDINNLELKEALAEQSVQHTKEDISTLELTHTHQLEVLNERVSKCITERDSASQLDTDGSELHCIFEEKSEEVARNKVLLENKLLSDIENLGVFVIDENDSKLVGLEASFLSVDCEIDTAKKLLKEKEDSLGEEVSKSISTLKSSIIKRNEIHRELEDKIGTSYATDYSAIDKQLIEKTLILEKEETKLVSLQEKLVESEGHYSELKELCCAVKEKEVKYLSNITKMQENVNYLNNKKAIEDNAIKLLDHSGKCQSCLQEVTEEYLVEARKDVYERLSVIQAELNIYSDRITKGNEAITTLGLNDLEGTLENALYSLASSKESVEGGVQLVNTIKTELTHLTTTQGELTRKYVQDKKDASLELSNDVLILRNKLDSVEHEVAKTLGSYQAKLNQLLETEDSRKEALLSQIEDRKTALKMQHGGKETNLRGVYAAEVKVLDNKMEQLTVKLEDDLKLLVKNKETAITLAEKNLQEAQDNIFNYESTYNDSINKVTKKLSKLFEDFFLVSGKVKVLQDKYEVNQLDIEDYDILLTLLSDQKGKASVVEFYLPRLVANVNKYLNHMGMYINLSIDNVFKVTMDCIERKGQQLMSLSEGELAKVNIAIMLGLREVSQGNSSIDCNLLVLDETLERLHPTGVVDAVDMLKDLFKELNLIVITQRGEEFGELFDNHKHYAKVGGVAVELDNNN